MIDIYYKLNNVKLPAKREKFPYNIEFTKKTIEIKTHNGRIYRRDDSSKRGGIRVYLL